MPMHCFSDGSVKRFRQHVSQAVAGITIAVILAGCGGKDPNLPETVSVSGTVSFKGEKLTDGTVMFHPQGGTGHPATGEIGENGIFTLTTFDASDGAVVGNHIVTVQQFPRGANPGFEEEAPGYVKFPKKYTEVRTSDLLVEVKAGANTLNLELEDE
ncbi:MAG: hypothetical protein R3C59_28930 [Planctomycetaceae bacterium]